MNSELKQSRLPEMSNHITLIHGAVKYVATFFIAFLIQVSTLFILFLSHVSEHLGTEGQVCFCSFVLINVLQGTDRA